MGQHNKQLTFVPAGLIIGRLSHQNLDIHLPPRQQQQPGLFAFAQIEGHLAEKRRDFRARSWTQDQRIAIETRQRPEPPGRR